MVPLQLNGHDVCCVDHCQGSASAVACKEDLIDSCFDTHQNGKILGVVTQLFSSDCLYLILSLHCLSMQTISHNTQQLT